MTFAVEFKAQPSGTIFDYGEWYFVQSYEDWQEACRNASRYSEEMGDTFVRVRHPSAEAKSPTYYNGAYCGGCEWE